jgi:hypothetical protein
MCSIPDDLNQKLEIGYKFIYSSLGVMFTGMIVANLWQWVFHIHAISLLEQTPFLLQIMILGGLIAFLFSLLSTVVIIPVWYEIRKYFLH